MNSTHFYGRLVADPELTTFESGAVEVKFTIAVSRHSKSKEVNSDMIPCRLKGALAQTFFSSVKKGHRIALDGSLEIGKPFPDKRLKEIAAAHPELELPEFKHRPWWISVEKFDFVEKKVEE